MDNQTSDSDNTEQVIIQEVPSSSGDYSDIVVAILTIPATIIVLAFFACIYRIFVNRRTRG